VKGNDESRGQVGQGLIFFISTESNFVVFNPVSVTRCHGIVMNYRRRSNERFRAKWHLEFLRRMNIYILLVLSLRFF